LFLRKIRYTSGASRNITKLTSSWFSHKRFNFLTWRKYSKAGRGHFGRIVTWTKGRLRRRLRFPIINYNFRSKVVSIVSTFYLIPFQNKLVALCFLASGSVMYLQTTTQFKLFSLINFPLTRKRKDLTVLTPTIGVLMYIKLLSRVSLLELYPGAGIQYVRSSGSFAKFIKVNWAAHTTLLVLPSGVRKSFSLYSLASVGAVSLKNKRLVRNTKAGFWKSYGWKSKVRGVAMNPIDHPHGGRTKAIKNPRTPWGHPTKLK